MQDNQSPQAKPQARRRGGVPKLSKAQWNEVKVRAEAGEPYEVLANSMSIGVSSIWNKAHSEGWVTPRRLQKGLRGELSKDDPATASANQWLLRKQEAREAQFMAMTKAVQRFAAMAPVPQTFGEAAIAYKLLNEAVTPPEEIESKGNVNLAILTAVGFQPRIQED